MTELCMKKITNLLRDNDKVVVLRESSKVRVFHTLDRTFDTESKPYLTFIEISTGVWRVK